MDKSKLILGILDCIHTRSEKLLENINNLDKEIYDDVLNERRTLEYDTKQRTEQEGNLEELLILRMDIMNLIKEGAEAE